MSVVSGGGGYGEKSYWDQRYANEDKYEIAQQQRVTHYHAPHFDYALSNEQWYLSYAQFKGQLLPHLDVADYPTPAADDTRRPRSSLSVLVVGCGNSALSKELFDDGFTDLHSIDYSEVVVDKMSQTYHDTPELKFSVMDVRSLTFPSSSFSVVLDKGTLDAILCGSDSSLHANSMLAECQRVLRPGGSLLIITYGQPSSRLTYLEQRSYEWDVTYEMLGGTRYMYKCTKRLAGADSSNGSSNGNSNGQSQSQSSTVNPTDSNSSTVPEAGEEGRTNGNK